MAKLYSYIRFSSPQQASGDSLRRQVEGAQAYAEQHGFEYADLSFRDLGISAFKDGNRASLDDLLTAIESGVIESGDVVYLDAVDRLSRQGFDHVYQLVRRILLAGVVVVAANEGLRLDASALNDMTAVIRLCMASTLAFDESQKKAARVRAAKAKQREQALTGKPVNRRLPYWLMRTGTGYDIHEAKAEPIRLIVELRSQGVGLHAICRELNAKGYPTRYGKGGWQYSTVADLIKHPSLYGALQLAKRVGDRYVPDQVVPDYFPALISFADWQGLQSKATGNAGGPTQENPLARLARCQCGAAMFLKISKRMVKGVQRVYRAWECTGQRSGACSVQGAKPVVDLDKAVIRAVKHLRVSHSDDQSSRRLMHIEQALSDKRRRLDEIKTLLVTGAGSVSVLASAAGQLETEIAGLEQDRAGVVSVTTDQIKRLGEVTDPVQWNVEARRVIDRVTVKWIKSGLYRAVIHQRNGFNVLVTAYRGSQRGEWRYQVLDGEWLDSLKPSAGDECFDFAWEGDPLPNESNIQKLYL